MTGALVLQVAGQEIESLDLVIVLIMMTKIEFLAALTPKIFKDDEMNKKVKTLLISMSLSVPVLLTGCDSFMDSMGHSQDQSSTSYNSSASTTNYHSANQASTGSAGASAQSSTPQATTPNTKAKTTTPTTGVPLEAPSAAAPSMTAPTVGQ